jgi:DNA polymerase II
MTKISGWMLDIYDDPRQGTCLWYIQEDGRRQKFFQKFPAAFYIAGPEKQLHAVIEFIKQQRWQSTQWHTERFDLFANCLLPVTAIQVANAYYLPALFHQVEKKFPHLTYYDTDIPTSLRHAALFKTFPLAKCALEIDDGMCIQTLCVQDTPWNIDPCSAPLSVMTLEPDVNPAHAQPGALTLSIEKHVNRLSLNFPRPFLVNLRALIQQYDPDILLTYWGDTWLLPMLVNWSDKYQLIIPLNRDAGRGIAKQPERSYYSYGQIVYHGQQTYLFGRIHIDCCNTMLWKDCGLEGVLETARVTRLSIQQAARRSPGTGISSMQIIKALENNILVPHQKQQVEKTKTALELLRSDQGGLVFQPWTGLHSLVGEIDFISMYPGIMVRCNISPETVASHCLEPSQEAPGLIPQTLEPLLEKRIELKRRLSEISRWDPRKVIYRQRSAAQKWLLVTCFGYLGYKNARFGRIEAHEAITANGREALLRAKEAAEDLGFQVLHMYVDGLWVQKPGSESPQEFNSLLEEIVQRTGLPIALNGIYRWVVFLPSRNNADLPVANRYFGVFQDGTLKTRGIEARRRDTAPFIADTQMEILNYLAQAEKSDQIDQFIPGAISILKVRLSELSTRLVKPEKLLYAQKLSRQLAAYRTLSPAARAAKQLQKEGKMLKPGQRVPFLFTIDRAGVCAWNLSQKPDTRLIDWKRYRYMLLQAARTILEPFGWDQESLSSVMGTIPVVQLPVFARQGHASRVSLSQISQVPPGQ